MVLHTLHFVKSEDLTLLSLSDKLSNAILVIMEDLTTESTVYNF